MKRTRRQVIRALVPEGAGWTCLPGCKSYVIGGGAVRFDYPASWIYEQDADHAVLRDRPRPDDRMVLEVSYLRLPPGLPGGGPPLAEMLVASLGGEDGPLIKPEQVHRRASAGMETCWAEVPFLEEKEMREARHRTLLARASGIQALFTLAFWPEDAGSVDPIWDDVVRSLKLGQRVTLPPPGAPA